MKVGLFDGTFHADSRQKAINMAGDFLGSRPNHIEWVRDVYLRTNVFTDTNLERVLDSPDGCVSIAWLLEPLCFSQTHYRKAIDLASHFDHIISHDKIFVKTNAGLFPQMIYAPLGGGWAVPTKAVEKSKLVSMFTTDKNRTPGHKLRRESMKFSDLYGVDLFGRGSNIVGTKAFGLEAHMYSIVIESCRTPGYFTEKLIDAMMCKCVPIYWGDPEIGEHFDTSGMIQVSCLDEIEAVLVQPLGEKDYRRRERALTMNDIKARSFICAEDWVFKNTGVFNAQ